MHFEVIGSRAANARVWAKLTTTTEDDLPTPDDLFNAALFTDNPGTPEARTIRLRDFFAEIRAAVADPAKLAADVAAHLPQTGGAPVDQAALEAALRNVLGSLG
jgi:hypothetical protein